MDGFAEIAATAYRDPRYAPPELEVERREDGSVVLVNPTPYSTGFLTANAPLDHWAEAEPSRIWLAERSGSGWRETPYGEGRSIVRALAGGLLELGLGPGRPLLITAQNGVDHALIAYAAMRIGAPVAPVSPQYARPGADPARLAHAVSLIQPAAVFVGGAPSLAARAESLRDAPVICTRNPGQGQISIEVLARLGEPADDLAAAGQPAKLLLTSGSTGAPKAVICTHENLAMNSAQIAACYDDPEPPVIVNGSPWSHSLGANAILHMCLHRGGTLYIDHGQPTPERFGETLSNLKEVSPTYHNAVPAGWALLADALEHDEALARRFFARLRVMQYGGAAMPQAVCDRIQAVAVAATGERITFAAGYGATETGPTACNVHWPNSRAGLLGLPIPGTQVKLTPRGEKWELSIKGPQISPGYRGADGRLIPLQLDDCGFYPTGDAARLLDPDQPAQGLVFDGRLAENFKLATGTFVAAGALRVAAVSAIGGAAADAVVCGEGKEGVGLLLFLNPTFCRTIAGEAHDLAALSRHPDILSTVAEGLKRLNAQEGGASGKVSRALILADAPDPHSGEVTDKGYINQALARTRRAAELERLFAAEPDPEVLVIPG